MRKARSKANPLSPTDELPSKTKSNPGSDEEQPGKAGEDSVSVEKYSLKTVAVKLQ